MLVCGVVQGVGFRPYVYRLAAEYKLVGYVINLGDAGVRIWAEGDDVSIDKFLIVLQNNPPSSARIDELRVESRNPAGYGGFSIKKSQGLGIKGDIAPDRAICEYCLIELRDKKNPRYDYPFISCVDCGPRFTSIKRLPYDRENTSYDCFPPCPACINEYDNPKKRRFHAQTISCPRCGPRYYLTDKKGALIESGDVLHQAATLLKEGAILTIKGVGGMHLACRTKDDEVIKKLRKRTHRAQQPFAIMALDIDIISSFASINKKERNLLVSGERPIVLLNKKDSYDLSDLIAPGLDSVGVMLPYTGLHHLLMPLMGEPLVLSSANMPGEPMAMANKQAIRLGLSDYLLLHDLDIVNRCDDSVMKLVNGKESFLRRSRGFAPTTLDVINSKGVNVLALGAEHNSNTCFLREDKAYVSQYIGNTSKPPTLAYLKQSAKYLMSLMGGKPDEVACDLHPGYQSSRLADEISQEYDIPLVAVQHHHAHLCSLLAEHGLDEIVCLCVDGAGYGLDDTIWGGEIIVYDGNTFTRAAHLAPQRMPGGDKAAYYPSRMLLGVLYDRFTATELEELAGRLGLKFELEGMEANVVLQQLDKNLNVTLSSSCGRVLDSLAALLGVCYHRSYDGEPAIKLEALGNKGKKTLKIPIEFKDGVLDTTSIVVEALRLKQEGARISDIAYCAQKALALGLGEMAVEVAEEYRIKTLGISGGVAYNNIIVKSIADYVRKKGIKFKQHTVLPPGDGCISLGQAQYVLERKNG